MLRVKEGGKLSQGFTPIDGRPARLSELVYEQLHQAILSEALAPGAAISEVALARELRVSKTPVREAVMRLRQDRLVESDGGSGLRVVSPSQQRLAEAYEVRVALESAAAALSAQRRSESEARELHAYAKATVLAAHGSGIAFREQDRKFHLAILASARCSYLEELGRAVLSMTTVLRARDVPVAGDSIQCAEEHVEIAKAITAADSEAAGRLITTHINHVKRNVLHAFSEARSEKSPVV